MKSFKIILALMLILSLFTSLISCVAPQNTNSTNNDDNNDNVNKIEKWYNNQIPTVCQNLQQYASSVSGISNINVTSSKFRFGEDSGWYDCHYTIHFTCKVNGSSCTGEARAFMKYNSSDITWFHFEIFRNSDYATIVEHYDESYDKIIEDYYKSLIDPTYKPSGNMPSHDTSSDSIWNNCPVKITGGIDGSSNAETIKLTITNNGTQDIDSIKLMVLFEHTGYDNEKHTISGYYTISDTVWTNSSINKNISGENYNFSKANIYIVCLYYKNGKIFGNPHATDNEIIAYAPCFSIKHYILNSNEHQDINANKNKLEDLEYIVTEACNKYNNGQTAYNGKLYATINSATSITIRHYISDSLPSSEQHKVNEMENIIHNFFSETLNDVFPEHISIYVETYVAFTEKSDWDNNLYEEIANNISDVQSVVTSVCNDYNSGLATFNNDNISATVNSATSITVHHTIKGEIAQDEEYIIDIISGMIIDCFEEAFELANFPQEVSINVESTYTLANHPSWISSDELDTSYNYYVWWRGEEIWIMENGICTTTNFILTGSPSDSFVKNQVYDCFYNGHIISIKYVDEILFWYEDLVKAGIISD